MASLIISLQYEQAQRYLIAGIDKLDPRESEISEMPPLCSIIFQSITTSGTSISVMFFRSALIFAIVSLCSIANAAPTPGNASQMSSKHNLYLATCTRRSSLGDCPLLIICPASDAAEITYSAIAYFANGPVSTTGAVKPSEIATTSQPPQPWEGVARGAKLGRTSTVIASIDASAATLLDGQIAGSAKLDTEDFVCFKDGKTVFEVKNELGIRQYSCTTDYWCPSIGA